MTTLLNVAFQDHLGAQKFSNDPTRVIEENLALRLRLWWEIGSMLFGRLLVLGYGQEISIQGHWIDGNSRKCLVILGLGITVLGFGILALVFFLQAAYEFSGLGRSETNEVLELRFVVHWGWHRLVLLDLPRPTFLGLVIQAEAIS